MRNGRFGKESMSNLLGNFYKGKRILVTGHTGFKGSWLALWLNQLGAKVIGYALKPPTSPSLFELCNVKKGIVSIENDISNFDMLKGVFDEYKPEIVIHMAAQSLVRPSYEEPLSTYQTNVMGTVNLFEVCRHTDSVQVIINVTSDKCYDNKSLDRGYREDDPMGGYDPYSSSKGCSELITAAYINSYFNPELCETGKTVLASVRSGNVIGGGDWSKDRLIPDCVRALTQGNPLIIRYPDATRPWQHVLEPLCGYLMLARDIYESGTKFSGGWNFGPDDEDAKPVKWLVERITDSWGNNASWKTDVGDKLHEAKYLKLDCSKAKKQLGWEPKWCLETALDKTIDWYKAYQSNENILNITLEQIRSYEN